MSPVFLTLLLSLHLSLFIPAHSVQYCCQGIVYTDLSVTSIVQKVTCSDVETNEYDCASFTTSTGTGYTCAIQVTPSPTPSVNGSASTPTPIILDPNVPETQSQYPYCITAGLSCCPTDNCNCPKNVHMTAAQVQTEGAQMRQIMYPIMGVLFGIAWVALAVVSNLVNHGLILMGTGLGTAVFGIFLIMLPITTYLGLLYIAIGSFGIAVVRGSGDKAALRGLGVAAMIVFLLTGGLTLVALDNFTPETLGPYMDRLLNTVGTCDSSMDVTISNNQYFNLSVRCENYLLFVCFCVFLLFLLQPFTIMSSFLASIQETKEKQAPQL